MEDVPPIEGLLQGSAEASIGPADLKHSLLHLVHLRLGQALDVSEFFLGYHLDPTKCADSSSFQLLYVGNIDTMVLQHLYVLVEAVLLLVGGGSGSDSGLIHGHGGDSCDL